MDDMEEIGSVETWESGGGISLDLVRLKDGSILVVSEEAIVLYADQDDLIGGENVERPTIIRP